MNKHDIVDNRLWAFYSRVSKGSQFNENQFMVLENYRATNHIPMDNCKTYSDVGSGRNKIRRGYMDLIRDIEAGLIKTVITRSISRVMRNYSQFGEFLEVLEKHNVRVHFLQEGLSNEGVMGRAMAMMGAVFAQVERELQIEDTCDGLERARRAGKRLGRPPGSKDIKKRPRVNYYIRWAKAKQSGVLGNLPVSLEFPQSLNQGIDKKA